MAEIDIKLLNQKTECDPELLIKESEENYRSLIDGVAQRVLNDENVKIILLAGPSGSGKTTSANLICDSIKKGGKDSLVISLDDFYRDATDPLYPKFDDGERDYESPDALNVQKLKDVLLAISDGKAFTVPKYDFKTGRATSCYNHEPIKSGAVIIEGLHALNPKIFSLLPKSKLLKIFISVSTNILNNGEIILSGRKIRFVRRMVRDSIYRNADAERTLDMWFNVLKGEDLYLYPNRQYADISFNTFHPSELGIMRPFVEKLISERLAASQPYARIVKSALRLALTIPLEKLPDSSLIREFVPGGIYESLY